jgi:hypothetical protein
MLPSRKLPGCENAGDHGNQIQSGQNWTSAIADGNDEADDRSDEGDEADKAGSRPDQEAKVQPAADSATA